MAEVTYFEENGKKCAMFDGRKYILRESQGYYYGGLTVKGVSNVSMLHRMVFIKHYGEIKQGYEIHHIDHNKNNNEIDNLMAMTKQEHRDYHAENMTEEHKAILRDRMKNVMNPLACEWHKSEEGRQWHLEHYEKMKDKLHEKVEAICIVCGKSYMTTRKVSAKCCSNACRAKERRMSGKDDEERVCISCGKRFFVNRFFKTECCSKSCSAQVRNNLEKINYNGENISIGLLARKFNLNIDVLRKRLKSGMDIETALNTPAKSIKLYEIDDEKLNVCEISRKYNVNRRTLQQRLNNGIDLQKAIEMGLKTD